MRRRRYDLDEVLALASAGLCASEIIEDLGLTVGERTIQKQVARYLGHRPTKAMLEAYDPLRSRVVAYMVAQGLDERYCSSCFTSTLYKCAIRALKSDDSLDSLVFVCRHCATAADR